MARPFVFAAKISHNQVVVHSRWLLMLWLFHFVFHLVWYTFIHLVRSRTVVGVNCVVQHLLYYLFAHACSISEARIYHVELI